MKTQKFRLSRIVMNFLLLVYAVFAIFPLIWMLLISFKSDTEVFTTTFLFHPTLSNYAAVLLESNYVQYMKDSLIVAGRLRAGVCGGGYPRRLCPGPV